MKKVLIHIAGLTILVEHQQKANSAAQAMIVRCANRFLDRDPEMAVTRLASGLIAELVADSRFVEVHTFAGFQAKTLTADDNMTLWIREGCLGRS